MKAIRLLPKRLTLLYPAIRKQRESGQARNTLIYGLTRIGPNSGAKKDSNMENEIPW